jgi:hypothetical protein
MASLDLEPDDDVLKVNALMVGIFGAIAAWRQYPGWQIDPRDAMQISKPLVEILNKYPGIAEKVLDSTAPVALVTSVCWMVGPRVVADRMYHQEMMRAAAAEAARRSQPPPGAPYQAGAQTVPPPPPGGASTQSTGFPKDLEQAAKMWADDTAGRAYDGVI